MHRGLFALLKYRLLLRCVWCSSICFCNLLQREFQCRQFACRQLQSYHSYTSCLHPWPVPCRHWVHGDWQCNWRCRSPLGDIASVHSVIDHIRMILAIEHKKDSPKCRAYMMLVGNYGRCMAFAKDPPYCVVYAADYKSTDDPSKMTPHEPLNHAFARIASNMVVRRLLSVPNWEPAEGNWLQGPPSHSEGHAFWSRVVSRPSHTAQPCRSLDWFNHVVGDPILYGQAFPSHRSNFFWSPRDLELFTAEEVAKWRS